MTVAKSAYKSGGSRYRRDENTRIDLTETEWDVEEWIQLAVYRDK
jgi:hypothetical protein